MRTRTSFVVVGLSALLSACASDYGGRISSDSSALSPEERRLQQAETKVAELSRRLDSVNLAGMDQENLRLRDDIRQLRGEMERLKYDIDAQFKRQQQQTADMDRRLQRFENPLGMTQPGIPTTGTPALPAPPPQYQGQSQYPSTSGGSGYPAQGTPPPAPQYQPPPPASTSPVQSSPGAVTTISQGSGASPEEEGAYLAAFDQLKNGKYDDAIKGFRSMLDRWPQGRYADNAWYWMGQTYDIKRDYKSALSAYQSLLQKFPTSPKAPDAMLHVGIAQIELKQEAEGRSTLQRVIQAYPSSNAAKLAQQRLEPPKSGG
jgi:tol-pal system protein YbgF